MAMRWQADPIGQHFSDRSPCPHCQLPGCPGGYNHEGTAFFCSVGIGTLHRLVVDGVVLWRYPNPSVVPPRELDPPAPIILSVTIPVHELELLRAAQTERDRLRARNDDLARQVEELHARLDVLETEPTAAGLLRMQRELAIERTMRKQQNTVIERADMAVRDRVIAAGAIEMAHAYRLPPDFGVDAPPTEPVKVAMGVLAQRLGVPPRSLAPALKAAAERGLLTRKEARHGEGGAYRTEVFIGPPTGLPVPPKEDLRRKADRERKEAIRSKRDIREANLSKISPELEAAARVARETGCPACGGDLVGISYFCAQCQQEHPISDLRPTDYRIPVDRGARTAPSGGDTDYRNPVVCADGAGESPHARREGGTHDPPDIPF